MSLRRIMRAWRLVLIIAAVLLCTAFLVWRHDTGAPAQGGPDYNWRFTSWGGDSDPQTQVTLVARGKSYTIGTYQGMCAQDDTDYLQFEKSKVVCWFAGGGHEVGVFEEPGQTVVRVGELDEGAAGTPGLRGNFTLVKQIK